MVRRGYETDARRSSMKTGTRWAVLGLVIVVAVVGFVIAQSGGGSSSSSSKTKTPEVGTQGAGTTPVVAPANVIVVRNVKPVGGVATLTVKKGQQVNLTVKSDSAQEIHVHGYDLHKTVPKNGSVSFSFPAKIDGGFVIELEKPGGQIASLKVEPWAPARGAARPAAGSPPGVQGKTDLPLPTWLFSWAAAIVLVVSFAALAALWPKPQLQEERRRRIGRLPEWLDVPAGAIGIAFFGIVVYAGFAGTQANAQANLATGFVYVHFWVGLGFVSVLFGNFFRSFTPWLAAARGAGWAYARLRGGRAWSPPFAYPSWLGYWPTVAGIVAFAWVELCYQDKTPPEIIAGLVGAYAVTQLAAMAAFGAETWSRRGDPFGTYFGVLG